MMHAAFYTHTHTHTHTQHKKSTEESTGDKTN